MSVLYDHQIFNLQKIGGISRYFYELIKGNLNSSILSIKNTENVYLSEISESFPEIDFRSIHDKDYFKKFSFTGKGYLNRVLNKSKRKIRNKQKLYSIDKLIENKYDLFHPTYFDPYFLDYVSKPYVLTVYDLTHEICTGYMNLDSRENLELIYRRLLCDKASRIICISENTKKDLLQLYNVDEKKIDVVYLGSSFGLTTKIDIEFQFKLPKKYILYTGVRSIYKNFYFFLEAVKPLLLADPELSVLCSGHPFTNYELRFFEAIELKDRVNYFFAQNDSQMFTLYNNAEIFIFPSIYEGFGIPILEAFSSNCPALLSHTSSLPEIGGDAALYFDPFSIESIRTSVKKVIYDDDLKKNLRVKGIERCKLFSWEKTIEQTNNVYNKVLG